MEDQTIIDDVTHVAATLAAKGITITASQVVHLTLALQKNISAIQMRLDEGNTCVMDLRHFDYSFSLPRFFVYKHNEFNPSYVFTREETIIDKTTAAA